MKHTPEPWSYGWPVKTNVWSEPGRGLRVARSDFDGDDTNPEAIENARRIVACVNACAGIPIEVLESPGYSVKAELDQLDAQIDARMKAEKLYRELIDNVEKFDAKIRDIFGK